MKGETWVMQLIVGALGGATATAACGMTCIVSVSQSCNAGRCCWYRCAAGNLAHPVGGHPTNSGRVRSLQAIVAAPLTVTGSIGVVAGKFNLSELYDRVGYSKTLLSRGKFAELAADNR